MDLREAGHPQRHPWEIARCAFLIRQLRRHRVTATAHRILDAGAGDAWFANQLLATLAPHARTTCWDAHYDTATSGAIEAAGHGRIRCTTTLPTGPFDLVTLLDVAEHVPNDAAFVQEIVTTAVRPAGWLLFTVPAWQGLFCEHDRFLQHYRRYSPKQARELLLGSGLQLVASGGLFHSLLPPRAATKVMELLKLSSKKPEKGAAWTHGRWWTAAVGRALKADGVVSRVSAEIGLQIPGLSWWALCRKQ